MSEVAGLAEMMHFWLHFSGLQCLRVLFALLLRHRIKSHAIRWKPISQPVSTVLSVMQ